MWFFYFTDCDLSEKCPWTFFLNLASFSQIPQAEEPWASLPLHADIPSLGKRTKAESWKGHKWKWKWREDVFLKEQVRRVQERMWFQSHDDLKSTEIHGETPEEPSWHLDSDVEPHTPLPGLSWAHNRCKSSMDVNPHRLHDLIQHFCLVSAFFLSTQAHHPVPQYDWTQVLHHT